MRANTRVGFPVVRTLAPREALDGEDSVDWWHWPDAGFAGRTPLTDPPD